MDREQAERIVDGLNQRVALGRFLESGLVPADNGAVERLHVRAALTRANFLFAGSGAGGERAAIAYTILGCCRISGINPVEYLTDVLSRLTGRVRLLDLPALMPAPWKASRLAAAQPAAPGRGRHLTGPLQHPAARSHRKALHGWVRSGVWTPLR